MSRLLENLNPEQRKAVTLPRQSALILAGAGSGKTRVLTTRIAYLIETREASPSGILAVTFTNKAAREMLTRLSAMLPINTRGMWVGTFHGLCNRLLRAHHRSAAGTPRTSGGRIIDVTAHPRVEEVCLAADALITDYSSLMFDFAHLDRPVVVRLGQRPRRRDHLHVDVARHRELVEHHVERDARLGARLHAERRGEPEDRALDDRRLDVGVRALQVAVLDSLDVVGVRLVGR